MPNYYIRNGYRPRIYVSGRRLPDNLIDGSTITIHHEEDQASSLEFTIRPEVGVQALSKYQGKNIIVNIQTSAGNRRVFTGVVDIDQYDINMELIRLRCDDNRFNRIKAIPEVVNTIGYYSADVFGELVDTNKKLEARMTTVPYSFNFDTFGNYQLTSWTPKATADYTLTNSTIYKGSLDVQRTNRSELINYVTVKFSYAYNRAYHFEQSYSWNANITVCNFLNDGFTLPTREMVRVAATAVGWPIKNTISYTDLWDSGYYCCSTPGASGCTPIGFISRTTKNVTYAKDDDQGNAVYDGAGNVVAGGGLKVNSDIGTYLCQGASWTATKRWTQNIQEDYELIVTAPDSTGIYGNLKRDEQGNMSDSWAPEVWEDYNVYRSAPDETITTITDGYYFDKDTERADCNASILTLLNRAKTTILKSHRQNTASFRRSIWPQVELHHTVEISTSKLTIKGKVKSFTHTINVATGEAYTDVTIAYYSNTGVTSSSNFDTIPTRPTHTSTFAGISSTTLTTHHGQDPDTAAAQRYSGYLGNRYIYSRNDVYRTQYTEQFRVDSPAIPASLRDTITLEASQQYNVEIPNNTLTITYTGTL